MHKRDPHYPKKIQDLARDWYNDQRGRVVGNTRAWEDLSQTQQLNIMDDVVSLLEYMEEAWTL